MTFNNSKFELMRYTRGGELTDFEYKTEEATSIARKSGTRNLGIVKSDKCKFNEEIKISASQGRGKAGWICRGFTIRGREEMLIL